MNTPLNATQALIFRLGIGLLFGLALAWLSAAFPQADKEPLWVQVATSVVVLGAFVLWVGAGAMRRVSFAVWGVAALGLIALFAWNQDAHGVEAYPSPIFFNLGFLVYPFLFVANELVSGADQSRKVLAPYPLYFEAGSKRAVQLAVSLLFTALFWGLLWMGAEMLKLIGFTWFTTALESEWVRWPALYLAFAASVHLSDVQPKLVHGFRALVLGVLSWLLPVITAIGVLFAVSLCFSGLGPLWKTKAATAVLLAACLALAVLINAAWQDGDPERKPHVALRGAARVAAVLLLAFSLLAAVSLHLRIQQYGLTPERVIAAVGVFLAVLFGLAYTYAAVMLKGGWMTRLGSLNVGLAVVMVVVFLAVLTPLADPYRLSAASQAGRVQWGAVTPDKFDWRVLRFETGTWGRSQLDTLAAHGRTADIRAAAVKAKAMTDADRYEPDRVPVKPVYAKPTATQLHLVYPAGGTIPSSFMTQDFALNLDTLPACMTPAMPDSICNVAMIDLNHDRYPEIVLQTGNHIYVFRYITSGDSKSGTWDQIQIANGGIIEAPLQMAFAKGEIKSAPPLWDNLIIGGARYEVSDPDGDTDTDD